MERVKDEKVEAERGYCATLTRLEEEEARFEGMARYIADLNGEVPDPAPERSNMDLSGAKNYHERLVLIAQAGDGTVHYAQAADALLDAGISQGTRRNLVSTLHTVLSSSDLFEKTAEKGQFRYLGGQEDLPT